MGFYTYLQSAFGWDCLKRAQLIWQFMYFACDLRYEIDMEFISILRYDKSRRGESTACWRVQTLSRSHSLSIYLVAVIRADVIEKFFFSLSLLSFFHSQRFCTCKSSKRWGWWKEIELNIHETKRTSGGHTENWRVNFSFPKKILLKY